MRQKCVCLVSAVTLGWTAAAGAADDNRNDGRNDRQNDKIIYSSVPKPLPGNVASVGPEAYAFREVGDGIVFRPGTGGTIDDVTVILSSWGCKTGHWYSSDCSTPRGATFSQAITLNIYAVIDVGGVPTQSSLLGTVTKTFDIPYRPSSDPAKCGGDGTLWYSEKDKVCYHGLATPIEFDFTSQHIAVPNRVIVGVAYNSSHYGPSPIGEAAPCYTSSGGCPYDSLNVSTDGGGARIGSVIDPNGIFINYYNPVPSENLVRPDSRAEENRRIIERDAGAPPFDWNSGRRPLQVAVAPRSREPLSPSSAQYRFEASAATPTTPQL